MDIKLRTTYWDDSTARNTFKKFLYYMLEIDLNEWDSTGYWERNSYIPFSFFQGKKIISSICVFLLDAIINRKLTRLIQICNVATLPSWRKQGLSRRLIDIGLEQVTKRTDIVFLYSTPKAIPFYKKCGFRQFDNYFEELELKEPVSRCEGAIFLNPEIDHDLNKIYQYAIDRRPISKVFSVLNPSLVIFHSLYWLRNQCVEIVDLCCIVFYKRHDNCLKIYDIVGSDIPHFYEIYPYIAEPNDRSIEFHFHVDQLDINTTKRKLKNNNLFIKGDFPITNPIFPFISKI